MRWLFLLMFALNLGYIAWEMSKPASTGYSDVPALKNVQPILLLSELEQQAGSDESEQTKIVTATAENRPDAVASKGTEPEKAGLVKAGAAQVAPEEVKLPEPVKPVVQPVAKAKKAEPVETPSVQASQGASCYTLGPFRDLDQLRGLTREIKSYVVKADFRGREEKEPTLYWVYIKPEKSRKKAIETGNRLKAKKIKDFYVIRDGDKENGLSLGHFRNKDGAYGLAKKVQKLGFDVVVEPVLKTYTVYWLDYQLSSGVVIPESIFDKYSKLSKKDKISRLNRDCGA